jgi:PAS domain S-box-containing protein
VLEIERDSIRCVWAIDSVDAAADAPRPSEFVMELFSDRKLAVVPPPPEDATWRLLDAVWDVPVGLGLCDNQLRFIRVNEALAAFDGLSVDAHYEENSLARLPAEFVEGLRQAALGEAHDVEFLSSGRCVLAKLHPVLRPTDRVAIGIGVVAVDVTDRRNAFRSVEEANRLVSDLLADATAKEEALSRLIESVQEGLLVLDPTGRMKLVNRAAERILGHPREALVGAHFEDERWWCEDGSGNRDATALLKHAVEQPDLLHGELWVETDAGRTALSADATSLRDMRGNVEEVVVSLRALTRERHELALARSNLEFQQQIIGIVGHDLRNPLATITGSIALLRRQEGLTRASVESLDRVARSAARMARLISDLLDYARTRTPGGLPVVLARADLHLICKDALEECRAAHPSTKLSLEMAGDGTGSWDADRIEQALINLITNAIQYGGTSTVVIRSIASAAHIVEIKVHNGGAVIPADVLPELFKAYRRGIRGESTARRDGLGLGLFIVAQIAAAHGGSAFAESSPESGTTFTIQLPRSVARKGP